MPSVLHSVIGVAKMLAIQQNTIFVLINLYINLVTLWCDQPRSCAFILFPGYATDFVLSVSPKRLTVPIGVTHVHCASVSRIVDQL